MDYDKDDDIRICEHCSEKIDIISKYATVDGKLWHEICFKCSNCSENLVNVAFTRLNKSELICHECYDSKYAANCIECNKLIILGQEKFRYGKMTWHRSCFKCKICQECLNPKSFWNHEKEYFCSDCYQENFTNSCNKCKEVIWSNCITYKDFNFHSDCFNCDECQLTLIDNKFQFKAEKFFCENCYNSKFCETCFSCQNLITGVNGGKLIISGKYFWHDLCFNCSKCQKSLIEDGFLFHGNDTIVCRDCKKEN